MPRTPTTKPRTKPRPLAVRLSQNIAARRRALGLTQAQLAERINVETETVSRFERGKHLPSLATLERLAAILLCTMADLLAEERPESGDDAMMLSAWLAVLTENDREFAKTLLLQCCNHLSRR
jgi:transcriptional regulator with XRE-family HTH domain